MKRFFYLSFFLLGVHPALLLHLAGCSKREAELKESPMLSEVPVSVTLASRSTMERNLVLVGTTNARADVNVVSETQGVARAVYVKVGDGVPANSVLVQVDDEIPRSSKEAAEINFQKAQRDYERSEELYQENSISIAQLDASRLAMKSAENQLAIARRQLENTRIKTPIAGTVNALYVEKGTMVQPGKAIANIVDINMLKVLVNVSEREAFQLKQGHRVEISTDVYPGAVFQGTIDNIASKADEAHTYALEIVLPNNPQTPLKAGMFARVAFTATPATDVLTIPRIALVGSIKDAQVYVVKQGIASRRAITVGSQSSELLEVLSGISEGDTIVTSGQNNLVDQARVTIISLRQ
jgi:RND family efflux transporter MFP subunit